MKKFIYFIVALMLVVMPATVKAAATSNGTGVKNVSDVTAKATATNNGEITIKISDVGADYYLIYRDNAQIAKITTNLTYVDKGLDMKNSYYYRIDAYKNNNYYSAYVYNAYPIKSLAKPKFTISKSGYTGLDFKITTVNGATSYDVYELVNGKYNQVNSASSYNNEKTVTTNKYSNTYGKHTFAVRAHNSAANIYSDYTIVTYNYQPESPVVKLKAINYDQNELTIETPKNYGGSTVYSDNIKVHIYRSTDNKKFTKIKTLSKISTYSNTTYKDTIKDAKLGTTYYYRAVFEIDGVKSGNSKVAKIKSALVAPTFNIYNSYNDAQTIEITNAGKNVKYKIYQATSKDGKYKEVCDTAKTKCDVKATINKKYFYKVKAYIGKTTSKFSSIKNLKLEMKSYEDKNVKLASRYNAYSKASAVSKYYGGYVYYNNYAEAIVKSTTLTKKSGGNTSKFELKITYKEKKSDAKKTMPIYITFFNYEGTKAYVVTINETFAKGTKKNVTSKHTIKIPRWAMFYEFS